MHVRNINGSHIALCPITKSDFPFVYENEYDMRRNYLWTNIRELVSYEQFSKDFQRRLDNNYCYYFVIKNNKLTQKLGGIFSYQHMRVDSYLYTTIYVSENFQNSIIGIEAGVLYYHYLFSRFNLRKIYCEVYEYNVFAQKLLRACGFQQEGCLKKHRFHNGNYHDLLCYAMFRDFFYDKCRSLNFSFLKEYLGDSYE